MGEEKLVIEILRNKNLDEFTKTLASSDAKAEEGSASAMCAAMSASLMARAADIISKENSGEEIEYLVRNSEILRNYMVRLIDEDVKCRGPLRRAYKEGGEKEIEASLYTACAINEEIISMMAKALELLLRLKSFECKKAFRFIIESSELAMAAVRVSRTAILDIAEKCIDETFVYVTKRENEITYSQLEELFVKITS